MITITIKLTHEDIEKLNTLNDRKNTFSKKIKYQDNTIGNIEIIPKTIVDSEYNCIDDFFDIRFDLGSHSNQPLIKYSVIAVYTVIFKHIKKVLLGQHLLVNTVDGERIYIDIISQY
ncbi:hypothetical protein FDB37_15725 [Clostridium botulinum]|uniref:hypothetical protein n=1 Tax=Clostridium botulinum TaxID=1491 RepID=UPI0013F053EF|nr:hypothetical protein [Clostridium botulinum]MBN1050335.1 hypothetical protein [Clostridium botulinum]NFO35015.1 hypothetical protein [Clostridium botulinum]